MPRYVIWDIDSQKLHDEPLFWSNKNGWVTLESATVFIGMERNLPTGLKCTWLELPEKEFVVSTDSNENWKDDLLQFARLIEEMQGCGLPDKGCEFEAVRLAMDICRKDLEDLFERARGLWEAAKEQT